MRIRCLHGYFIFEETRVGQVSDFMSYTGLALVSKGSYYTFETIFDAPKYSLATKMLLGIPAVETFEGEPFEVFEANGFVYDFVRDLVVPIEAIIETTTIAAAGNRFVSPGLILPGTLNSNGQRVKSYDAWFSRDTQKFLYSEVEYV